jgi:hypothetical protein
MGICPHGTGWCVRLGAGGALCWRWWITGDRVHVTLTGDLSVKGRQLCTAA